MDVKPADPKLAAERDVRHVPEEGWRSGAFPASAGLRTEAFQVVIKRSVLNDIHEHGQSRPDIEICGVLVGDVYQDEQGVFLYVQSSIRGDFADGQAAQVTFTAETWAHIQSVMDAAHSDLRIIGWYHTHPGFGIFLSSMDLFIHENFFGLPWQIALVYDPLSGEDGVFVWREGQAVREEVLIEEDAAKGEPKVSLRNGGRAEGGASAGAKPVTEGGRLIAIERRQRLTMTALGVLVLVILPWMIYLTVRIRPTQPGNTNVLQRTTSPVNGEKPIPPKNDVNPVPETAPPDASRSTNGADLPLNVGGQEGGANDQQE